MAKDDRGDNLKMAEAEVAETQRKLDRQKDLVAVKQQAVKTARQQAAAANSKTSAVEKEGAICAQRLSRRKSSWRRRRRSAR